MPKFFQAKRSLKYVQVCFDLCCPLGYNYRENDLYVDEDKGEEFPEVYDYRAFSPYICEKNDDSEIDQIKIWQGKER